MPRNTTQVACDNTSDASFRAWANLIPAILAAAGWVQTTDTGQSDFNALATPNAVNQSRGYQIWRTADATGSLNNYYLKIEVGSGGAALRPAIWVTVGWGSDGAGTITGNASTRIQFPAGGNLATLQDSNLWGNTGALCFSIFTISGTYNIALNLERVRNVDGSKKDEIFIWGFGGNPSTSTSLSHVIPITGVIPTSGLGNSGQKNITAAMANYGADIGLSTISPVKGAAQMEATNIFGADTTNFSTTQTIHDLTVLGESRKYILNASNAGWAGGTSYRLLTRFDL